MAEWSFSVRLGTIQKLNNNLLAAAYGSQRPVEERAHSRPLALTAMSANHLFKTDVQRVRASTGRYVTQFGAVGSERPLTTQSGHFHEE